MIKHKLKSNKKRMDAVFIFLKTIYVYCFFYFDILSLSRTRLFTTRASVPLPQAMLIQFLKLKMADHRKLHSGLLRMEFERNL
jgi:hypothetical protein